MRNTLYKIFKWITSSYSEARIKSKLSSNDQKPAIDFEILQSPGFIGNTSKLHDAEIQITYYFHDHGVMISSKASGHYDQ